MSTPANIDFCVSHRAVIDLVRRWVDAMGVRAATARSATSVTGARDSARDFRQALARPAMAGACTPDPTGAPGSIEVAVHDRRPQPTGAAHARPPTSTAAPKASGGPGSTTT